MVGSPFHVAAGVPLLVAISERMTCLLGRTEGPPRSRQLQAARAGARHGRGQRWTSPRRDRDHARGLGHRDGGHRGRGRTGAATRARGSCSPAAVSNVRRRRYPGSRPAARRPGARRLSRPSSAPPGSSSSSSRRVTALTAAGVRAAGVRETQPWQVITKGHHHWHAIYPPYHSHVVILSNQPARIHQKAKYV